jgi:hypothetical protein
MIPFLNVIGTITLVVGGVLWVAMLKNGLSNMRQVRTAPEPPEQQKK